ncbi:MAG: OmpA family protein [Bacteroidales bacterium]|nr:OmpA family protein [Bacteroidales bacterium]
MMKKIIVLLFVVMSVSIHIQAQKADSTLLVKIEKDKALASLEKKIIKGDKYFEASRFDEALDCYLEVLEKMPDSAEINYKIGNTYLQLLKPYKALNYFEKAEKSNYHNSQLLFQLARTHHLLTNYDKAIAYYFRYDSSLTIQSEKDVISKLISECNFGKAKMNQSAYEIYDAKDLNSEYPEYNFMQHGSRKLVAARKEKTIGNLRYPKDNKYYEDIYFLKGNRYINAGRTVNSRTHDAPVCFSISGDTLFIYKDNRNGDLYYSVFISDTSLARAKKIKIKGINTRYAETSLAVSPDSKTIVFVSNRPGGKGGKDLYMVQKIDSVNWSTPSNIDILNSPFDEEAPSFSLDGKSLFFSSKGHNAIGGFDIFVSNFQNGQWSTPQTLGIPINSTYDELFFRQYGDTSWFASSRESGLGDMDIYYALPRNASPVIGIDSVSTPFQTAISINALANDYDPEGKAIKLVDYQKQSYNSGFISLNNSNGEFLYTPAEGFFGKDEFVYAVSDGKNVVKGKVFIEVKPKELPMIEISGKILSNGRGVEGVKISVTNSKTNYDNTVFTDSEGNYTIKIKPDECYDITMYKQGYFNSMQYFNCPGLPQLKDMTEIEKIEVNKSLKLENINYPPGGFEVSPAIAKELDKTVAFLNENPTVVIEISSHCDSRGSAQKNLMISQKRADAASKYIISKGISPKRIVAKGFGEKKLLNKCSDGVICTEEEHAVNRRTEIKILSM